MKVELPNKLQPRRGDPVKVGNVYSNAHGKNMFRIVVSLAKQHRDRPFNNVIMLTVDSYGNIIGTKQEPENYVKDHLDLVGAVKDMPVLKVKWIDYD